MYSKAEALVVSYLKSGLSNKEIADKICISETTVKFHLTNIYKIAGVKSRAEFIVQDQGNCHGQAETQSFTETYIPKIQGEIMLDGGAKPLNPTGLQQGARQVQMVQKSQEEKITFIDDKFKVGETIQQLHSMMKDVTKNELTPNTVNAACNCVARLNETIHTAIQAARFLNER